MIVSITVACSLRESRAQTCGLATGMRGLAAVAVFMALPPCCVGSDSLECRNQLFKRGDAQDRWHTAWFTRELRAADWNVDQPSGLDLHLAMTKMPGQIGQPDQLQRSAKQWVTRIGDGDFPLAFLRHQGCITLGGVSPRPLVPAGRCCVLLQLKALNSTADRREAAIFARTRRTLFAWLFDDRGSNYLIFRRFRI